MISGEILFTDFLSVDCDNDYSFGQGFEYYIISIIIFDKKIGEK